VRKDWQTLELCDRFFDAIEHKDYETLESCYAPEAVIWHSHDCLYQSRADNLAMLKRGMETLQKVEFRDRRIRVFEGGFVQQHTIYVTRENGFVGRMDVCFVAYVRDGMISRAYEYFDHGQREQFVGPAACVLRRLRARRDDLAGLRVLRPRPARAVRRPGGLTRPAPAPTAIVGT